MIRPRDPNVMYQPWEHRRLRDIVLFRGLPRNQLLLDRPDRRRRERPAVAFSWDTREEMNCLVESFFGDTFASRE